MPQNRKNSRNSFITGKPTKNKKKNPAIQAAAEELLKKDTSKASEATQAAKKPTAAQKKAAKKKHQSRKERSFLKKLSDQAYIDSGQQRFGKESIKWFSKLVKDFKTDEGKQTIRDKILSEGYEAKHPKPGQLFFWHYDAITKDKLPYWDSFPLDFLVNENRTYIWGLNTHYIPREILAKVMKDLLELKSNQKWDEKTRLKLSYQILLAYTNASIVKFAFKKYRKDQFLSKMIFIPSDQWESCLWLPLAQWNKASQTKVWKDARKAYYK